MGAKRYRPEEIISKLREAEILLAHGVGVGEAIRRLGVTQVTYYRWRKEYGGMKLDQAKRLRDLEKENARLKRLLADVELDKAILKEAASGNWWSPPANVASLSIRVVSSASLNAGLAGWWASTGRPSGESRGSLMMRMRSPQRSSSWPIGTAAMGIAGSLHCSSATAGT